MWLLSVSRKLCLLISLAVFSAYIFEVSVVQCQIPNTLLVPVGSEVFASCTCGKIRDVNAAKQGDFPWTAALVNKDDIANDPLCWGVVINSRYILTVAHCSLKYKSTDVEIFIAAPDLTFNARREVSNIKLHPGFNVGNFTYDNDIALVKMRDPLDLESGNVYPVCLPPKQGSPNFTGNANELDDCDFESEIEGKTATMNKFKGYRTEGNQRLYQFRQADFMILTTTNCSHLYPNRVKAQTLCGEAYHGLPWNWTKQNCHVLFVYRPGRPQTECFQDSIILSCFRKWLEIRSSTYTCSNKDSGAPLLHLRQMKAHCDVDFERQKADGMQMKYTQIGMSTAQKECRGSSDKKPTLLFTKLTRYVEWIYENTMDGMYCQHSKT